MIETFKQLLAKNEQLNKFDIGITIDEDRVATLTGEVDTWQQVVDIGHIAGGIKEIYSVVNNITVKGLEIPVPDYTKEIETARKIGVIHETDVLVIGAGVSGCSVARTMSKHSLRVAVVDMHDDVSMGASKANSGAIHPGHMAKAGTLKAKLNVKGNAMFTQLHEELGFDMKRRGGYGIGYDEEDKKVLEYIVKTAKLNGVPGCDFFPVDELLKLEPNIKGHPIIATHNTTMGTVEPYEVVIALANSAALNGVKFILGAQVYGIEILGDRDFTVITRKGLIRTKYIVNAAGVHADDVAEMVDDKFFTIHARRGTIPIFDKRIPYPYSTGIGTVSKTRNVESKGGGCGMTPEGNINSGPSATETPYKDDTATYKSDLDYAMRIAYSVVDYLKPSDVITYFTGVRAADYKEDFIIGMSKKVSGFVNVAAIQSPGFASSPAVAEMVEGIILEDCAGAGIKVEDNPNYDPYLKPKVNFRRLSHEEQDKLIQENPKYGHVICRCETITEGEILDVIHSPIVPTSVDAIKRRTRAGMGRCQGGFCQQKVVEILARELGKDWVEINLKDEGSNVLAKHNREEATTDEDA